MRTRLKKGTNQFKVKSKNRWAFYFLGYIFVTLLIMNFAQYFKNQGAMTAYAQEKIVSPLGTEIAEQPMDKQSMNIRTKIREVFGEHADKAFKVLSCENASLNPNAVNTAGNEPAGSRDIGVFQINEYWQKTQGRFLFDPEINIRAAYIIFKDNGYTFERWTCGRKLGI